MDQPVMAAVAQISPIYMDKDETITKVCQAIHEAGARGADLIVFSETMIPGYPYWRSVQPNSRWTDWIVRYQQQSVRVGTDDTDRIAEAARNAQICVVVGCSELSDRPGSATLYNSLLFFECDGTLVGRHRKLIPTHAERMIWGRGDPSDLAVFDMSIGKIGGLVCYEHHVTTFKAVMAQLGEEIHCAVWPGWIHQERLLTTRRRWREGDDVDTCDIGPAVREYAFETQTFVVSASQFIPAGTLPSDASHYDIAAGGSSISNPSGQYLVRPQLDREVIAYAELDPAERMAMKAYFDAQGHYARWDAVQIAFDGRPQEPIVPPAQDLRKHAARLTKTARETLSVPHVGMPAKR